MWIELWWPWRLVSCLLNIENSFLEGGEICKPLYDGTISFRKTNLWEGSRVVWNLHICSHWWRVRRASVRYSWRQHSSTQVSVDRNDKYGENDVSTSTNSINSSTINGKATSWLQYFLKIRLQQQVTVQGNCSDRLPILSGAPPNGLFWGPVSFFLT